MLTFSVKIIQIIFLYILTATFFFVSDSCKKEKIANSNLEFIEKHLAGDWLDSEYVSTLSESKSPESAKSRSAITGITIKRNKAEYEWIFIYGFHEGVSSKNKSIRFLSHQNCYQIIDKDSAFFLTGKNDCSFYITELGNVLFLSALVEKQEVKFLKIGKPIKEFSNGILIVGKYRDTSGNIYTFEENGSGIWDKIEIQYEIPLDGFGSYGYDWLTIKKNRESNRYIYNRINRELKLYRNIQNYKGEESDEGIKPIKEDTPFLILTKLD